MGRIERASARSDGSDMRYFGRPWKTGETLQSLTKVPAQFRSMSSKLREELIITLPEHLKRKVSEYDQYLMQNDTLMNGTQVLFLLLESFKHDDGLATHRTARDLYDLKWFGDTASDMSKFHDTFWNIARNCRDSGFTDDGLMILLADKMLESKDDLVKYEMNAYKTAIKGQSPKTLEYVDGILMRSIQRLANDEAREKDRKDKEKLLAGHLPIDVPMPSDIQKTKRRTK